MDRWMPRAWARALRRDVRRVPPSPPDRPALPLLGPAEARRYIASVRARVLDVLERVPLDPERPLLADGFVYGMVVQHEHQHDETMLATLQLMDGTGYPSDARHRHRRGPASRARRGAGRRRRLRHGHRHRAVGLRQRAPRPRGARRPLPHRHRPGDQAAPTRSSSTPAATTSAAGGRDAGWAWRRRGRARAPGVLAARGRRRWSRAALRPARAAAPGRAGAARVLVRGRRLRRLAGQAAAHRGRVGEGGRRGTRDRTGKRRYPWGDEPPDEPTPTSASGTSGPRRWARTPPAPAPRLPPDDRRRVGVDLVGLHRRTPASVPSPTASTPRCSSARTTRCCGAARGRRTRAPCAPRSATGTTRSAGRSSPASAARGTR